LSKLIITVILVLSPKIIISDANTISTHNHSKEKIMLIKDLSHLEIASKDNQIQGGRRRVGTATAFGEAFSDARGVFGAFTFAGTSTFTSTGRGYAISGSGATSTSASN
jgi:hypothetical protein